uniref:OSJNBa0029C04.11 protein n=1 Tax=Oryza sativa subsp. japonica TaxID=39947 RepID=Q7XNB7_ORYSJ|nr:OSJNBa0029C04.11 [Oryza sativa Japonica Group]
MGLFSMLKDWTIYYSPLALQVILLLLAGTRRRKVLVPKIILWIAYQLADSTAIYALGNLSFGSVAIEEHRLAAFWAPFLLLHLGGPDNITAYALEDNKLWLRHALNLIFQVIGACYVVYKHIIVRREATILRVATGLISAVGVVKYCERTWALYRSNFSSIGSSLEELQGNQLHWYQGYLHNEDHNNTNNEFLLQRAHSLFHICKRGIVDSVINEDTENAEAETTKEIINNLSEEPQRMYKVMEMELSLMYDILYTKAAVVHTWIGYCIRALSPFAIATSFLLFYFCGSEVKDGQNGVDTAVTYVLLGGALLMETTSLLSALGSSWTLSFLCARRWSWLQHVALCVGRWYQLRRAVLAVRKRVAALTGGLLGGSRNWSGTIGQFNLLYFRATQVNPTNKQFGRLIKKLGYGDEWDTGCYLWDITIPELVKQKALRMVSKYDLNTMGLLRHNWGELALKKHTEPSKKNKNCTELLEELEKLWGDDFHGSIIICHIATDLILAEIEKNKAGEDDAAQLQCVGSIRALSNYLMFLLVAHPDMLRGLPQKWLYQRTCENVDQNCKEHREELISSGGKANNVIFMVLMKLFGGHSNSSTSIGLRQTNALAKILYKSLPSQFDPAIPRLTYARLVAKEIINWKDEDGQLKKPDAILKVLLNLWTDFLLYAANRCNRESHAKKLNTGAI